ncbi:MAG: DNA -binding domain-containing protein [Stellaceae bacterium]
MTRTSKHQLIRESPPAEDRVTDYDRAHLATYLRLLDAEVDRAPWMEVAQIVLGLDPAAQPERALKIYESHLSRAKWMSEHGYRDLLRGAGQ